MRQLDGNGGTAEDGLDAFQRALEVGALAIELIDDDCAGQLEFIGELPHLLGLNLDAGHPVHQDQGGIGGDQRRLVSLIKMLKPGVSRRLIFFFFHSTGRWQSKS